MKTRLMLILVMSSLSAFVWGQNNHSPQISLNYLSQQKDINLRSLPGISLPASKVKDQKPTSLKERCIAISNTENNVKIDSFLLFYSYGRGSVTEPNSDGTYDMRGQIRNMHWQNIAVLIINVLQKQSKYEIYINAWNGVV